MEFEINLNGHPGLLPSGEHRVRIKRAHDRIAKCSGNQQLVLEMEAVDGEHQGKVARGWLTVAPGTELVWKYFGEAAFPEADGDSIQFGPDDLVGREVVIKVEWPDDAEYPQVKGYYPVEDLPVSV